MLRKFLAGDRDASSHEDWAEMVRQATAQGRRFSRVRVVSMPPTDYTRCGFWVSGFTTEAGDDIRYLNREQATDLPQYDYWLFDSRRLFMMHFTDDDQFVGAEAVEDPSAIVEHNYWRDVARHHAVPRKEFVAEYEQRNYTDWEGER